MARVFAKSLTGIAAALVTTTLASAQNDAFAEGVKAYRLGELEQAKQKFEEVLAADPSHEDAFDLYRKTDAAVWQALLLEQDGGINQFARHMLELAKVGRSERSRDADAIAALVEQATDEAADFQTRYQAVLKLRGDHAEFAVPALARVLGDADADKGQIAAQAALVEIGRDATPALIELLRSDNDLLRRNVVAVLGNIKDERAVPALQHVAATDSSDVIRETAATVVDRMGASGNALSSFLRQAEGYLSDSGVRDDDRSPVTWSFGDGELAAHDVPAVLYNFELAKKAAHDALAIAPDSEEAQTLLARAYLGQAAAIRESLASNPDDEALAGFGGQVAGLVNTAAATGVDVVRRAVNDSIAGGMGPVAVAGIELLGQMESRDDLDGSPLVAAVSSPNKEVSYAAALALAKVGGAGVPAAGNVVDKLAQAVGEKAVLNIRVIDSNPVTQSAVMEASLPRGTRVDVADSAVAAMNEMYRFPNVDVVVLSENTSDALPEAIIGLIRKHNDMAKAKILVIAEDVDAATERFGDRIDGAIQGPVSADSVRDAVNSALEGVELDATQQRAARAAVAASTALQSLARDKVDISGALVSLAQQLTREDAVAVPAAQAIGHGGGVEDATALLAAIRGEGSDDLKVACAEAIGNILGRTPAAPQDLFGALVEVATGDAEAGLRAATVRALGKAKVDAQSKAKLIEALRVRPSVDS